MSMLTVGSRPSRGFEPRRRHCVVVLEEDTFILAEYWFNPGRTERLLMGRKESKQTKTNAHCTYMHESVHFMFSGENK